jgi:uncharacterized membrane protein (DUF2068 family)
MIDTQLEPHQPSLLIKLIALKKGLFALVLIGISLLSAFSWRNFDLVTAWSESYIVNAEYGFVRWLLGAIAHAGVPTLRWVARLSGIYGGLLWITAIGLWQGRTWADPLFATLVGVLIPIEVLELLHHATLTKAIIFVINLLVFTVVCKHWLDSRKVKALGETV